ncbi:unnamed protein product [marine sediment metagenome]|uniref:Uncharacterized protein n=1 Tax=marine sediment metagenome TaxID=412755 RepID=X0ZB99_9ZZZZ
MKWNKENVNTLIQYLTAQDMPTNLIARLMAYTRENVHSDMTLTEVTAWIDDLYECVGCLQIEHEQHLTDVNGIGILCPDCLGDL